MMYKIIFFIAILIATGIILNSNCNCNEDKDKPYDIIQLWIIYLLCFLFVNLKHVILFILIIFVSFIIKEILKFILSFKKKKKINITKEDCDCKNAYKRFFL